METPKNARLVIATAQFPTSHIISDNAQHILRQMKHARELGADVIHFCEGALSGYAGVDFASFEHFDWDELKEKTQTAKFILVMISDSAIPLMNRSGVSWPIFRRGIISRLLLSKEYSVAS